MIFKGGLPVTTKQSVREHGYGLKNVKKVLDKYKAHWILSVQMNGSP